MRTAFVGALTALLLIGCGVASQSSTRCTKEMAIGAERAIDGMTTWPRIFEAFTHYGQCDDGVVAEGFDDKIVRLLVEHWESTDELSNLSLSNPRFEKFVLKHIDTLMSPNHAKTIILNAEQKCPVGARKLCDRLIVKARYPDE